MASILSAVGNVMFYLGLIGSIVTGIKYTHPLIQEFYHKSTICNISSITYVPYQCQCDNYDSCTEESVNYYYCWNIKGYFWTRDIPFNGYPYQKISSTYRTMPHDENCFVPFGSSEHFGCLSSQEMGDILVENVRQYLPIQKQYFTPHYYAASNSVYVQEVFQNIPQFDCYTRHGEDGNNQTVIEKVEDVELLWFTPTCLLVTFIGLYIVKKYGHGWVKDLGKWFYEEFLLLLISIPYNVVCWVVYLVVVLVYNCFGTDVAWTWDVFMRQGGLCCLCVQYHHTGECPVSCCMPPEQDPPQQNDVLHDNQDIHIPFGNQELDLPPCYSEYFRSTTTADANNCEPPKYSDLDDLPPVYDLVVESSGGGPSLQSDHVSMSRLS